MKSVLILILVVVALILMGGLPVFAANLEVFDETELGAKVDAPDLIKITQNSSIGIEAGVYDLHQDWKDSSFAYIKYTYRGSLLDLTK